MRSRAGMSGNKRREAREDREGRVNNLLTRFSMKMAIHCKYMIPVNKFSLDISYLPSNTIY